MSACGLLKGVLGCVQGEGEKKLRIDKTYSEENKCGGTEEATSASRMEKWVWR
jgi:hypothetical protein